MTTRMEKILLAVGLLCAAATATVTTLIVPQFRQVFVSFGAELPLPTYLFVHYSYVLWLLPALVLVAWLYWPKPSRRALVASLVGIISLIVIVPALVVSMYLPIFNLGQT